MTVGYKARVRWPTIKFKLLCFIAYFKRKFIVP